MRLSDLMTLDEILKIFKYIVQRIVDAEYNYRALFSRRNYMRGKQIMHHVSVCVCVQTRGHFSPRGASDELISPSRSSRSCRGEKSLTEIPNARFLFLILPSSFALAYMYIYTTSTSAERSSSSLF